MFLKVIVDVSNDQLVALNHDFERLTSQTPMHVILSLGALFLMLYRTVAIFWRG